MRAASPRRRKSSLVVGLAAMLAAALVLAGCGTSGKSSSSPPLPGVTDTSVKLGFSIVDLGELANALGFIQPDYGGYEQNEKVIKALVDYVNKNGGMGGRQVTPERRTPPRRRRNGFRRHDRCLLRFE